MENKYRYPLLLTVHIRLFRFHKRPASVPVFTNQNKLEKDFRFYYKRRKVKIVLGVDFAGSCYRGSTFPTVEVTKPSSFPQELQTAAQHQAAIVLNCVYEHLCFLSVYFVHLLARCNLRYWKRQRSCKSVNV